MKSVSLYLFLFLYAVTPFTLQVYAEDWFYVRWVNDGDTIVLKDGSRVRYIGINSPEVSHEGRKAEPYADSAKNFNKRLVFAQRVGLEFDKEKKDHYGRLLAYINLKGGGFVNKMLLEQGMAYVLYRQPNIKYHDVLLKSQKSAMQSKKGIWSRWEEEEGRYLANTKSKRFHLESCPFGKQTAKQRRVYFRKKWDAFWEGYAPGKRCFAEQK